MSEHVDISNFLNVIKAVHAKADDLNIRSVAIDCRLIECSRKQALEIENVLSRYTYSYERQCDICLASKGDLLTYKFSGYPREVKVIIHLTSGGDDN